jgi:hypothetical protein
VVSFVFRASRVDLKAKKFHYTSNSGNKIPFEMPRFFPNFLKFLRFQKEKKKKESVLGLSGHMRLSLDVCPNPVYSL